MENSLLLAGVAIGALALGAVMTLLLRPRAQEGGADADLLARLYVLIEREAAVSRSEATQQRGTLSEMERGMMARIEQMRAEMAERLGGIAGSMGRSRPKPAQRSRKLCVRWPRPLPVSWGPFAQR